MASICATLKRMARLTIMVRAWHPSHARVLLRDLVNRNRVVPSRHSDADHLSASAGWLARAQDAQTDGGIAAYYRFSEGWSASYPETTGYLVPTFLRLAQRPGLGSFEERAGRAIEFLLRCQLPEGGFPAGLIGESPKTLSVFNSAQIVCGLVAWHRHTKDQRALDAAIRAGDWLVAVQDSDGAWRRHSFQNIASTYAAHASCWLAELGVYANTKHHRDAALSHLAWVLTHVDRETGWFDLVGFNANEHRERIGLTHTIAYTLWGVLMTSQLLGVEDGLARVEKAAREIVHCLETFQWLPGILDWRWHPRAKFSCVTGTAQMALIWLRLFEGSRDQRWIEPAMRAIELAKGAQAINTDSPAIKGAVPGSVPLWGSYMRLAYPNWAAKFFTDALLEKERLTDAV